LQPLAVFVALKGRMTNMSLLPERYFLYADDDADDRDALVELIDRLDPGMHVATCTQGLELMQFLEALNPGDPLPCCVILDMNMPMWDGLYTLEELKKHPQYQHLYIVMFTTSSAPCDEERSMALGAEAFITKPLKQAEFEKVAKQFSLFCEKTPTKKQELLMKKTL
jgi:CheY-like chemotaxis protein